MIKEVFFLWQYNKTQNSDELYHWKYATKKKVNGKWRYYYDDTGKGKPKKGLSINNMDRYKTTFTGSMSAPGVKSQSYSNTYYNVGKIGEETSKDVYDHGDATLLYNGEPVKDIAKRKSGEAKKSISKSRKIMSEKVKDLSKTASKQINKGKSWLISHFK